jgi:hypothetical protein
MFIGKVGCIALQCIGGGGGSAAAAAAVLMRSWSNSHFQAAKAALEWSATCITSNEKLHYIVWPAQIIHLNLKLDQELPHSRCSSCLPSFVISCMQTEAHIIDAVLLPKAATPAKATTSAPTTPPVRTTPATAVPAKTAPATAAKPGAAAVAPAVPAKVEAGAAKAPAGRKLLRAPGADSRDE